MLIKFDWTTDTSGFTFTTINSQAMLLVLHLLIWQEESLPIAESQAASEQSGDVQETDQGLDLEWKRCIIDMNDSCVRTYGIEY